MAVAALASVSNPSLCAAYQIVEHAELRLQVARGTTT